MPSRRKGRPATARGGERRGGEANGSANVADRGGANANRSDHSEALRRGYARSEERNAAVRAHLAPLAPGERPPALLIATLVASALALANLVAFAAGVEIDGRKPNTLGVAVFELLAVAAAVGTWQRRYWAVLGFEAALGITIAFAAISLMVASNLAAVVLCVAVLVLGGWLFWKLIRVMGRLQAPPHAG